MRFGHFSVGCFRYEFCHLWVRFWDGSWCVVNLKSYSFQNGYGYVQEAKISAREAQLPIRSEKHLKLKFWQTSRFLNVFSDFPLVQATLDVDVARCECDINMVVGALYTLGLTLSKHDMIKFASVALRAEGGAFSWTYSRISIFQRLHQKHQINVWTKTRNVGIPLKLHIEEIWISRW